MILNTHEKMFYDTDEQLKAGVLDHVQALFGFVAIAHPTDFDSMRVH